MKPNKHLNWEYMLLAPKTWGVLDPKGKFKKLNFDSEDQVKTYIEDVETGAALLGALVTGKNLGVIK